jgi:hypothetical protein
MPKDVDGDSRSIYIFEKPECEPDFNPTTHRLGEDVSQQT